MSGLNGILKLLKKTSRTSLTLCDINALLIKTANQPVLPRISLRYKDVAAVYQSIRAEYIANTLPTTNPETTDVCRSAEHWDHRARGKILGQRRYFTVTDSETVRDGRKVFSQH